MKQEKVLAKRQAYFFGIIAMFAVFISTSCEDSSSNKVSPYADRISSVYEVQRYIVQIPYGGGLMDQNVYLLYSRRSGQGIIIDPGSKSGELESFIEGSAIAIKGILNTHGHFDHTGANGQYRMKYGADVYAHSSDRPLYQRKEEEPTRFITAESSLRFGDIEVKVLHTPGHTEGSVCFLVADRLFSGDTLFQGSVGRTPDNAAAIGIIDNIMKKLLILPQYTYVYPGHGDVTTIGKEKETNPFLQNNRLR